MAYSLQNPNRSIGINTSIYNTVREYRKPIPVDYLARLQYCSVSEIQIHINRLEEENLIRVITKKNRQYVKQK